LGRPALLTLISPQDLKHRKVENSIADTRERVATGNIAGWIAFVFFQPFGRCHESCP